MNENGKPMLVACQQRRQAVLEHGVLLYKTLVFTLGDPLKE